MLGITSLVFIGLLIFLYIQIKNYMASEYYQMTHVSFLALYLDKGKLGEYYTYKYLNSLQGYKKYLFNCYIPKEDGTTTEIDVILLHESGIYVFESKNYSGWIFGTETQREWTQTLPAGRGRSHKTRFFNPIIQNKVHLKWLQVYLQEFDNLSFFSYIVFSDRCELKNINLTSYNHYVVNRYDLLNAVLMNVRTSGTKLSEGIINAIYLKLFPLTQVSEVEKLAHIQNIKNSSEPHTTQVRNVVHFLGMEKKICPRCGGQLVLRTSKKGAHAGKSFYGCANFPKCRYIENKKD